MLDAMNGCNMKTHLLLLLPGIILMDRLNTKLYTDTAFPHFIIVFHSNLNLNYLICCTFNALRHCFNFTLNFIDPP